MNNQNPYTKPVVVVGPVYMDVVLTGLTRLPATGEEVHAQQGSCFPGGYAISATAFSRLGFTTHLYGDIGTDSIGQLLSKMLTDSGVILGHTPSVNATNIAVALNWAGDRGIASYTHPMSDPTAKLKQDLTTLEPGLLYLSARHPKSRAIAQLFSSLGWTIVLSLSWHPDFLTSNALQQLLAWADIIFANVPETLLVSRCNNLLEGMAILADAVPEVVVTRGSEGALARSNGSLYESPANPVPMVDATGAGDVFAATYTGARLLGWSIPERLSVANWAAGQAIGALGGGSSAPTWTDLIAYRQQIEGDGS